VKTLLEFFGIKKRVVVRTVLAPAALSPDMQFVVDQLSKPQVWQPAAPFTKSEQAELRALLASPLMRKLDVIMYNAAQQQMRDAVFAPPAEMVAQGKFAAGFVAAWQRFKSFSVIALTETGEAETTAETGAAGLEQHIP
jgi:hypothetical protein